MGLSTNTREREQIDVLGINFDNVSMPEAVERIEEMIHLGGSHIVCTPNVHHLIMAFKDTQFNRVIQDSSLCLTDGMPIVWLSYLLGTPLKERVAGSDLVSQLCQRSSSSGLRLFFLGAAPGVAEKARDVAQKRFPGCQIVGTYSPNPSELNDSSASFLDFIVSVRPDILLVALGPPKQEKWLSQYLHRVGVPVGIGIGASLDFMAGNLKRAPRWMQRVGLEWFYRLIKEPRRLAGRYFYANSIFIWKAVGELIKFWKRSIGGRLQNRFQGLKIGRR